VNTSEVAPIPFSKLQTLPYGTEQNEQGMRGPARSEDSKVVKECMVEVSNDARDLRLETEA